MTHLLALAGVLAISFSAVFVRLAGVSPVTAAFFRAAYAVPVLAGLRAALGGDDRRSGRMRWLAFASGLALAGDLAFWHESIALIGAGLGTVIANVQVVFVAGAAWLLFRERPSRAALATIPAVLAGILLTSGLARPGAYGADPTRGVLLGVAAGACYAAYLLVFRAAARKGGSIVGLLLDSTIGLAAGALAVSPFDAHFSLVPSWPAHGWLVALALLSQVVGWLAISAALPRLLAVEGLILLLMQPVFTVVWGGVIFGERLSPVQWAGTALVLAGVGGISTGAARRRSSVPPKPELDPEPTP